jgi:flagellar hook-basal body complex protein FliE
MADLGLSNLTGFGRISDIVDMLQNEARPEAPLNDYEEAFSDVLRDALAQYREHEAGNTAETLTLLTGNTEDLSSTMIAAEKAELALNLTISIRNKAITAYNQIMNMQL